MAENENETPGADLGAAAGEQPQAANAPQAGILAQYVKDLSFENPKAAQTLQRLAQAKPQIQVNVNVSGRKVGEEAYEVELKIGAESRIEDDTAFQVELVYAGLFGARNLPDNVIEPFLLVQAPAILFPFARRVIADAVRDGGYPPLMLEPIDFGRLYQQQRQQAQQDGPQNLEEFDLSAPPSGNA